MIYVDYRAVDYAGTRHVRLGDALDRAPTSYCAGWSLIR